MKKSNNLIKWAIGIVVVIFFLSADFTPGTKMAIGVGAALYWMLFSIDRRLKKVENEVGVVDIVGAEKYKTPSYKLDIVITPEWHEIIKKLAKDNKTTAEKFVNEIKKDKSLNTDEDKSLYGKSFRFVYFYNHLSNLEQIWSDHYKTFIDDIEIRGNIFETKNFFSWINHKKYKDNNISNTLVIRPEYLGFHTILPDGDVMDEDKFSIFPFNTVLEFFIIMHNSSSRLDPMRRVKKFPGSLVKEFKEDKIKYEDEWNIEDYGTGVKENKDLIENEWTKEHGVEIYDQYMKRQVFSSPYCTISLKMEIFD
ncbi:MAG: hypothetical protein RB292_03055 [Patescibacteria group bacterium]|jgi:hypothetical protein|nr:hypothetical protein [Patescibacteria group bacterium]